jgi:hypothetical protein
MEPRMRSAASLPTSLHRPFSYVGQVAPVHLSLFTFHLSPFQPASLATRAGLRILSGIFSLRLRLRGQYACRLAFREFDI